MAEYPFANYPGNPPNMPNEPHVDRLLGNAYAVVRFVAQSMEHVEKLSLNMPDLLSVSGSIVQVNELAVAKTQLLALQANLTDLLALHASLSSVTVAANNLATLQAIELKLVEINSLYTEMAKLSALYSSLGILTDLHTSLDSLVQLRSYLPELLDMRAVVLASAAEAAATKVQIDHKYRGALAADPPLRSDGTFNQIGDEYFYTGSLPYLLKRWNGATWQASDINTANLAAAGGAGMVGWIRNAVGAIATTLAKWLGWQSVSVAEFLTDAELAAVKARSYTLDVTAGVQAAINAPGAAKTLVWPEGGYLCGELTYPDGIRWRSKGATLKCTATATAVNNWIRAAGTQQSGSIKGLTFDYQLNANGRHILALGDNARSWAIEGCTFANMKTQTAIRTDYTATLTGNGFLKIKGNTFTGGQAAGALEVHASAGVLGVRDISVVGNDITDCGSSLIAIAGPGGSLTKDMFLNTRVSGNRMIGNGTGVFGTIPTEFWGHTGLLVKGNIIDAATRGVGTSVCEGVTVTGNTISNQTSYAAEIGDTDNFVFSGNTVRNCKTLISGGGTGATNWSVSGNTIDGTGLASVQTNTYMIAFAAPAGGKVRKGISVTGNIFRRLPYVNGVMRLNSASDVLVADNQYVATSEFDPVTFAFADTNARAVYRDNLVIRAADYTINTPDYDALPFMIRFLPGAASNKVSVLDNTLISTAAAISGVGFGGIGYNGGAAAFTDYRIERNTLQGAFGRGLDVNDNSNTMEVRDNDTSKITELSASSVTANYTKLRMSYDGTAAPTVGAWRRGDYVRNRSPSVGQPKGWVCTVAGTPGTWVSEGNL